MEAGQVLQVGGVGAGGGRGTAGEEAGDQLVGVGLGGLGRAVIPAHGGPCLLHVSSMHSTRGGRWLARRCGLPPWIPCEAERTRCSGRPLAAGRGDLAPRRGPLPGAAVIAATLTGGWRPRLTTGCQG